MRNQFDWGELPHETPFRSAPSDISSFQTLYQGVREINAECASKNGQPGWYQSGKHPTTRFRPGGGNSSNSGADYVFLISRRPEQYRGLHLAIRIRDQRTHQRIRRWREWVIKSHRYRLRGKVVARKEEFVAGRVDGYLLVENGRVLQSM